jgi:hypothetical protein
LREVAEGHTHTHTYTYTYTAVVGNVGVRTVLLNLVAEVHPAEVVVCVAVAVAAWSLADEREGTPEVSVGGHAVPPAVDQRRGAQPRPLPQVPARARDNSALTPTQTPLLPAVPEYLEKQLVWQRLRRVNPILAVLHASFVLVGRLVNFLLLKHNFS